MGDRFAESSWNAVSDIVELALYSISVLLILPAELQASIVT
jgi:hypothetical protein